MTTKVILPTPGAGTWTVPADCTSATIELLGAGTNGTNQFSPGGFKGGGAGGGGGQYATITLTVTPGDVLNYHVGIANGSAATGPGIPGSPTDGDTWFLSSETVFARGAYYTQPGNLSHGGDYHPPGSGLGGGAPFPWAWNDGGASENVNAASSGGSGGGAGGPDGPGGRGRYGGGLWEGAAGGGAANGGAEGNHNSGGGGGFSGWAGGAGGNNRLGTGGGAGSTGLSLGQGAVAGTAGGGGGGGWGVSTPSLDYTNGADGSTDNIWGGIYGPGGGGGGGGGGNNTDVTPNGGIGGNGAQFGGGGGGTADPTAQVGLGGQGLIVITYTQTSASHPNKGVVYNHLHYILSSFTPPVVDAPTNTVTPHINGATVGVVSTCSQGTWTGTLPITYSYQWTVDGVNVGTDANTYTPISADFGKLLECIVTATNSAGTVPAFSNRYSVAISGESIDIPDAAALAAAAAAWPTNGNKTWRLTGSDYGTLSAYAPAWVFDSAPVVIDGLGTASFEWIEMAGASGITFKNFNVYGYDVSSGASIYVHSDNVAICNLAFENVTTITSDAQGTQTGNGWMLRELSGSTVTIIGQGSASLPDIFGRGNALTVLDCFGSSTLISISNLTVNNNGVDGFLIAGSQNVTIDSCLLKNFYSGA
jgi:hypothetical protein